MDERRGLDDEVILSKREDMREFRVVKEKIETGALTPLEEDLKT